MMTNHLMNFIKSIPACHKRRLFMKYIKYKTVHDARFYHNIKKMKIKASCSVDLRSDTFTKPNMKMRNVMKEASVGDDVWQEDETVLELEDKMATLAEKDAGLYVISGTMGNLLCVLSHCSRRGAEVLLGNESHIFLNEQANIAQFGGVQPFIVQNKSDGTFCLKQAESCIRTYDFHHPSTELICIENTHGNLGGKILPLNWLDEVVDFAKEKKLPLHVDGARIFNASVGLGVPVSRLLRGVNSASICLSKSLGAPVGTVIVGDNQFIEKARRLRKALGGGWRQAGILAAAGLYALNHNVERLQEDHNNAKLIAKGINEMKSPYINVCFENVHTNIVMIEVNHAYLSPEDICRRFMEVDEEEENVLGETISVLAAPNSSSAIRLVTHLDVSQKDAEAALSKIKYVIQGLNA